MPVGMTGWAQVHGLRGNTSIVERARLDNYYIEHWSLWLDLVILLRTMGVLLRSVFVGADGRHADEESEFIDLTVAERARADAAQPSHLLSIDLVAATAHRNGNGSNGNGHVSNGKDNGKDNGNGNGHRADADVAATAPQVAAPSPIVP
jgi:hypothetical protein